MHLNRKIFFCLFLIFIFIVYSDGISFPNLAIELVRSDMTIDYTIFAKDKLTIDIEILIFCVLNICELNLFIYEFDQYFATYWGHLKMWSVWSIQDCWIELKNEGSTDATFAVKNACMQNNRLWSTWHSNS